MANKLLSVFHFSSV